MHFCGMKKMMKIGAEKYHVELSKVWDCEARDFLREQTDPFKRSSGVLVKVSGMFWHSYYMNISK